MDPLFAADAAVKEAVPAVVSRHRTAGVLTWALLRLQRYRRFGWPEVTLLLTK